MIKLRQLLSSNVAESRKPANLVRAEGSTEATLYIYDVIDAWYGVAAIDVAQAISSLGADTTLHVRLNTPGGDVFEGRAIRTALQQFKGKTIAHIDGLCASAGTTIADACDEIIISQGAFYMIHNGWTFAMGNKNEIQKTLELLTKVDEGIVRDYVARTGLEASQIISWMDAETWFTADEAIANGFATSLAALPEKTKNQHTQKLWDLTAFDKAPQALLDAKAAPQPTPPEPIDYAANRAHNERRLRVLQIA